jgi:DNA-binding NarL/FixJ family response regulator
MVDDHTLFRKAIVNLLSNFGYAVEEASDGKEALAMLNNRSFDLVVTDLQMPVMDGYDFTKEALALFPDQKVIVLTMHDSYRYIKALIELGVKSYLTKNIEPTELQFSIEEVLKGKKYFQRHVMELIVHNMALNEISLPEFTDRELLILRMIADEKTVAEIASELSISTRTVEAHKLKMLEKAQVKSTIGLVKKAVEDGFLK